MKKYLFKFTKPAPEIPWWDGNNINDAEVQRLSQYQLDTLSSLLTGPNDRLIIEYNVDGLTANYGHECSIELCQLIEDRYATDPDLILLRQLSNAYYEEHNVKVEIYEDDVFITRLV